LLSQNILKEANWTVELKSSENCIAPKEQNYLPDNNLAVLEAKGLNCGIQRLWIKHTRY